MSTLVLFPNKVLQEKTQEVTEFTDEHKTIIEEMWSYVNNDNSAGIAANQLGYAWSIIAVNNIPENDSFTMINPVITDFIGDKMALKEGCLSLPYITGNVERYLSIRVQYMDEDWKLCEGYFVGVTAHIIQHEVDHLDGILYIDRYGKIRRDSMIKKFNKQLKKHR